MPAADPGITGSTTPPRRPRSAGCPTRPPARPPRACARTRLRGASRRLRRAARRPDARGARCSRCTVRAGHRGCASGGARHVGRMAAGSPNNGRERWTRTLPGDGRSTSWEPRDGAGGRAGAPPGAGHGRHSRSTSGLARIVRPRGSPGMTVRHVGVRPRGRESRHRAADGRGVARLGRIGRRDRQLDDLRLVRVSLWDSRGFESGVTRGSCVAPRAEARSSGSVCWARATSDRAGVRVVTGGSPARAPGSP